MPEDSGSKGIKVELLALNVLVRKARKFELPSSNNFRVVAKKTKGVVKSRNRD